MQTPFITDLYAMARPLKAAGARSAAIALRYLDHTGRQVGTSVLTAADLAELGRAMIALADAAIRCAAGADGAARPPHHHFPMMRDLRVAESA